MSNVNWLLLQKQEGETCAFYNLSKMLLDQQRMRTDVDGGFKKSHGNIAPLANNVAIILKRYTFHYFHLLLL